MNIKTYRKVLLMVSELHVRGYQRIRIAPGMAPSGCYWRCAVAPVTNISDRNGAHLVEFDGLAAHYSSGSEAEYFGWKNCQHLTPSQLASRFIDHFPAVVAAGRGRDWMYVGWYQEMLNLTYPDLLPVAYDDDGLRDRLTTAGERRGVTIPMPPPGDCPEANAH